MPFGLFMVAAGSLCGAALMVFTGRGVPVGGGLLIIAGLLPVMLGPVADQISQLCLSQLLEASFVLLDDSAGDLHC